MIARSDPKTGHHIISRAEMLDAIYEQAQEHFWLCQSAIARRDWSEAEAQKAKHDACRKAFYQVEAAPVVGQA